MNDTFLHLSFIVPCLNEEKNIIDTIRVIRAAMVGLPIAYEIVVVDDGSTDATAALVQAHATENTDLCVRLVRHPENLGLGRAYCSGVAAAQGKDCFVVAGDNEFPESAIRAVMQRYGEADILMSHPQDMSSRPLLRRVLSRSFTMLLRLLSGHRAVYFHGPAVYPTALVRSFPQTASGFGYFAELFCVALNNGHRVLEIPTEITTRKHGGTAAFRLKNMISVAGTLGRIFGRRVQHTVRRLQRQ